VVASLPSIEFRPFIDSMPVDRVPPIHQRRGTRSACAFPRARVIAVYAVSDRVAPRDRAADLLDRPNEPPPRQLRR